MGRVFLFSFSRGYCTESALYSHVNQSHWIRTVTNLSTSHSILLACRAASPQSRRISLRLTPSGRERSGLDEARLTHPGWKDTLDAAALHCCMQALAVRVRAPFCNQSCALACYLRDVFLSLKQQERDKPRLSPHPGASRATVWRLARGFTYQ